jgi:hypothetical protein
MYFFSLVDVHFLGIGALYNGTLNFNPPGDLALRNARRNDGKPHSTRRRTGISANSDVRLKRIFDEIEQIRRQVKKPKV